MDSSKNYLPQRQKIGCHPQESKKKRSRPSHSLKARERRRFFQREKRETTLLAAKCDYVTKKAGESQELGER